MSGPNSKFMTTESSHFVSRVSTWIFPIYFMTFLISLLEGRYLNKDILLGSSSDRPGYPWIATNPIFGEHYFGDFVDVFNAQKLIGAGGYFGLNSVFLKLLEPLTIEAAFLAYVFVVAITLFAAIRRIKRESGISFVGSRDHSKEASAEFNLVLFACFCYPMLFAFDRGNGSLLVGALIIFCVVNYAGKARDQERILASLKARSQVNSTQFGLDLWIVASISLGLAASGKLWPVVCSSVFLIVVTRSWRAVILHWATFAMVIFLQIALLDNFFSLTYVFSGTNLTDSEMYQKGTNTFSNSLDNPVRLARCTILRNCGAMPSYLRLSLILVLSAIVAHGVYLVLRRKKSEFALLAVTTSCALSLAVVPSTGIYNDVIYLLPVLGYGLRLLGRREDYLDKLLWTMCLSVLLPTRFGIVQISDNLFQYSFSVLNSGIVALQYLLPIFVYGRHIARSQLERWG